MLFAPVSGAFWAERSNKDKVSIKSSPRRGLEHFYFVKREERWLSSDKFASSSLLCYTSGGWLALLRPTSWILVGGHNVPVSFTELPPYL